MADLATGRLAAEERHVLDQHLAECPECQATVRALISAAGMIENGASAEPEAAAEPTTPAEPEAAAEPTIPAEPAEEDPVVRWKPRVTDVDARPDPQQTMLHWAPPSVAAEAVGGAVDAEVFDRTDEVEPRSRPDAAEADAEAVAESDADADADAVAEPVDTIALEAERRPESAVDDTAVNIWAVSKPTASSAREPPHPVPATAAASPPPGLGGVIQPLMSHQSGSARYWPPRERPWLWALVVVALVVAVAPALALSGSSKPKPRAKTNPSTASIAPSPSTTKHSVAKPAKAPSHAAAAVARTTHATTKPKHTATTPATSTPVTSTPAASTPAASAPAAPAPSTPSTPAASNPAPTTHNSTSGSVSVTPQGSSLPAQTAPTQGIGSGG
jgi:hypothetical protein